MTRRTVKPGLPALHYQRLLDIAAKLDQAQPEPLTVTEAQWLGRLLVRIGNGEDISGDYFQATEGRPASADRDLWIAVDLLLQADLTIAPKRARGRVSEQWGGLSDKRIRDILKAHETLARETIELAGESITGPLERMRRACGGN